MKRHTLVPLFLFPLAALAADPFACVDPDVVDAFIDWHADARYSTALPPALREVPFPAEFELVATRFRDSGVTAAFRTEQDRTAAFSASVRAVAAAGWEAKSNPAEPRGFQTVTMSDWGWTCRSGRPEAISITAKPRPDHTLLAVTVHTRPGRAACGARPEWSIPLRQYVPDFDVPGDARVERNTAGGGDDEYSARLTVAAKLSREEILEHFGEQLREQDWDFDSAWSGRSSAGTVWTSADESGAPLYGTLRVVETSPGLFYLRFSVVSFDAVNRSGGSHTVVYEP